MEYCLFGAFLIIFYLNIVLQVCSLRSFYVNNYAYNGKNFVDGENNWGSGCFGKGGKW